MGELPSGRDQYSTPIRPIGMVLRIYATLYRHCILMCRSQKHVRLIYNVQCRTVLRIRAISRASSSPEVSRKRNAGRSTTRPGRSRAIGTELPRNRKRYVCIRTQCAMEYAPVYVATPKYVFGFREIITGSTMRSVCGRDEEICQTPQDYGVGWTSPELSAKTILQIWTSGP